jgi:hypothetical protein
MQIRRGPVLAIILAGYTMIVLDISIVITALPQIHHALGFASTALSWVENAYLLAFGGLLLLGACAGDLVGRRRVFIAGFGRLHRRVDRRRDRRSPRRGWLPRGRSRASAPRPSRRRRSRRCRRAFARGRAHPRCGLLRRRRCVAATVGLVVGGIFAGRLSWRVGFFIKRAAAPRWRSSSRWPPFGYPRGRR